MGDIRVKDFWDIAGLRSRLQELSRRCSKEDLKYVVDYLEERALPQWKEAKINWDRVEIGNVSPVERYVPAEILYPSVYKLREKMNRIQKEAEERELKGEKLELDD